MLIPKRILVNFQSRLRTMSDEKLNEMLKTKQEELENLKSTQTEANYQYLSFPIEQKIALIKQELKLRNSNIEFVI